MKGGKARTVGAARQSRNQTLGGIGTSTNSPALQPNKAFPEILAGKQDFDQA
jgi:hypothetical protein